MKIKAYEVGQRGEWTTETFVTDLPNGVIPLAGDNLLVPVGGPQHLSFVVCGRTLIYDGDDDFTLEKVLLHVEFVPEQEPTIIV